jgi:hypothetical protein
LSSAIISVCSLAEVAAMPAATRDLRRQLIRTRVLAGAGAIAVLGLLATVNARAEDGGLQAGTRLASIGGDADGSLARLGFPPRDAVGDLDLRVIIARTSSVKTDAQIADDTILVALALNVPQSTDDDIAKQYGLELVDRTELPELGIRIVQFRLPANKAIGPVLAELHADQRIRRAQRNSRYEPVPPATAPAPPAPKSHVGARPSDMNKTAVDKPRPAPARADQTLRVGNVGDVLSGGL